jgi:hypothetical protein
MSRTMKIFIKLEKITIDYSIENLLFTFFNLRSVFGIVIKYGVVIFVLGWVGKKECTYIWWYITQYENKKIKTWWNVDEIKRIKNNDETSVIYAASSCKIRT